MSNSAPVRKQQLKLQLSRLQKELNSVKLKHTRILSQCKKKLNSLDKRKVKQRIRSKEFALELLKHSQLRHKLVEVGQHMRRLEKHQQYREEPEWQHKLEQLYFQKQKQGQRFVHELHQKRQHCEDLEQQLIQLAAKNEKDTVWLLQNVKKGKELQQHLDSLKQQAKEVSTAIGITVTDNC